MTVATGELPPALRRVTEEEDVWRVEKAFLGSDPRVLHFGRDEDGDYYERKLYGAFNEEKLAERLEDLEAVPAHQLGASVATARRYEIDDQWRQRQVLMPILAGLYRANFFTQVAGRMLEGEVQTNGFKNGKPFTRTLVVHPDGGIGLKIKNEGLTTEEGEPLVWHRYVLPRKTGRAYHDELLVGADHVRRAEVIDPSTIITAFRTQLDPVISSVGI